MAQLKYYENKEKMPRFIYFRSIATSLIITVIIMLILAAIITYTSVSESIMPAFSSIITILSIAFSGLLAARTLRKRGLIHGLITGAIYILLVIFLSWVFIRNFSVDKFVMMKGMIGIFSGGIGGMIGVNLK
ncbi:MAG: TIGR04086 family membrane protein [Clostridia bacterium]|nr:TIGR04086 family membrane protein [Clostridia bacterium]